MRSIDIALARKQAGLTQAGLAKILDVSPASISRWEHGQGNPTPKHLLRIEDFLKEFVFVADTPKGDIEPVIHQHHSTSGNWVWLAIGVSAITSVITTLLAGAAS